MRYEAALYFRRLVSFDGWGGVLVVQSRGHLWGCSCRHAASQQGSRRNPEAGRRCSTVTRTKHVWTQTKPLLQGRPGGGYRQQQVDGHTVP